MKIFEGQTANDPSEKKIGNHSIRQSILNQIESADISDAEKWVIKDRLYRRSLRARANRDFSAFCESIIKSEEDINEITGQPEYLDLMPFHEMWCEILQSIVMPEGLSHQLKYISEQDFVKIRNERRAIILSPRDTGKTSIFTQAFPLWVLGMDSSYRIGIISKSSKQARRPLVSIKRYILADPDLKSVFPELFPLPSETNPKKPERWTTEEIIVNRSIVSGNASICSYGVGSKSFLGCRLNLLIIDDLVSFDAMKSMDEARAAVDFYNNVIKYSVVEKNGITIAIGTPWSNLDLLSYLSKQGWPTFRFSCEHEEDGYTYVEWEKRIPKSRLLEEKRSDIIGYNRNRRCRISSTEEEIFSFGRSNLLKQDYSVTAIRDWHVAMGMDLSTAKRKGTALCISASDVDGQSRIVLDIARGQWQPDEKANKIRDYALLYKPEKIYVEDNSLQADVVRLLIVAGNQDLPIEGWTTKRNKHAILEAMSLETRNGLWRWNLPECARETLQNTSLCKCDWCEFVREVMGYPNYTTSDMLMAWMMSSEALKTCLESEDYYRYLDSGADEIVYMFQDYFLGNRTSESRGFIPQPGDQEKIKYIKDQWGSWSGMPTDEMIRQSDARMRELLYDMGNFCMSLRRGQHAL